MTDDWDSALYDDKHSFVHEYGADVLDLLAPQAGERVLDLGCGTGHLTAALADAGADAVGLDASEEMLAQARARYPDLAFVRGDAREFAVEESFDAVFSNAALHWVPCEDQPAVAAAVRQALRPGGRFVAEMGGVGNVERIVAAVQTALAEAGYSVANPWCFPSVGEQATVLEDAGFRVTYARLFDRPTELDDGPDGLRNWLSMFGEDLFAETTAAERETVVSEVEDRLRPALFDGGTWTADYTRLRFVAGTPA